MARLWFSGGEAQHFQAEGCTTASSASPYLTFDTTTKRVAGTRASYKFDSTGTPTAGYAHLSYTTTNGRYYYFRFYIMRSSNTGQTNIPIVAIRDNNGTPQLNVRINSSAQLTLYNVNAGSLIGSASSALAATTWYKVEVGIMVSGTGGADCYAELRLNDTTVASSTTTTFGTVALGGMRFGWYTAPTASEQIWFDDCALNDNQGSDQTSWCGDGTVWLLLPTADNARGANWYCDNAATSNLYDALNNTPPQGVAHAPSTMAATAQIYNIVNSSTDPASKYDATMQTYTAAGIPANDTISVIQLSVESGTNGTTARARNAYILSNPAESAPATFNTSTAACSTYPTGWYTNRRTVLYNPSVTRGTAPVVTIHKEVNNVAAVDFCFAGIFVESYVQASTSTLDALGRVTFAEQATLQFTGRLNFASQQTRRGVGRMRFASQIAQQAMGRLFIVEHGDTFDRANQSGIGTPSDGSAYTNSGSQTGVTITGNTYQDTNVVATVMHCHGDGIYSDVDMYLEWMYTGTYNSLWMWARSVRKNNANACYRVRYTSGSLRIYSYTAGVGTQLDSATVTTASGTWYCVRVHISGTTLQAKMWERGTAEPGTWTVQATDSLYASGYVGFGDNPGATSGAQINIDNFWYSGTPSTLTTVLEGMGRLLFASQQTLQGMGRLNIAAGANLTTKNALGRLVMASRQTIQGMGRVRFVSRVSKQFTGRLKFATTDRKRAMGVLRFFGRTTKNATGRLNFFGKTSRRATGRLRLFARTTTHFMGRTRFAQQVKKQFAGRMKFASMATRNLMGRTRFASLMQKNAMGRVIVRGMGKLQATGRLVFFYRTIRNGMGRMRFVAQVRLHGMGRLKFSTGTMTIRNALGRFRFVARITKRFTGRFILATWHTHNALGRMRYFGKTYQRATGRVKYASSITRNSAGRLIFYYRHVYSAMGKLRFAAAISRRFTGRLKIHARSTRNTLGRFNFANRVNLRGRGRVRFLGLSTRNSKGKLYFVARARQQAIGRLFFATSQFIAKSFSGRILFAEKKTYRAAGRMNVVEFHGQVFEWEAPDSSVDWQLEGTVINWQAPDTRVTWDEPVVETEWQIPETGVVWKRKEGT